MSSIIRSFAASGADCVMVSYVPGEAPSNLPWTPRAPRDLQISSTMVRSRTSHRSKLKIITKVAKLRRIEKMFIGGARRKLRVACKVRCFSNHVWYFVSESQIFLKLSTLTGRSISIPREKKTRIHFSGSAGVNTRIPRKNEISVEQIPKFDPI